MKDVKVVEICMHIKFEDLQFAFDVAKVYYKSQNKDCNYCNAVMQGRQLLQFNKDLVEEFEDYVGIKISTDVDVAAFGFAIMQRYAQLQEEAAFIHNTHSLTI
ncbi:MAG: hypothetical protein IJ419_14720 [Agathobacter sp.]|nr:hypothetical protein [Agathobacter sp.]